MQSEKQSNTARMRVGAVALGGLLLAAGGWAAAAWSDTCRPSEIRGLFGCELMSTPDGMVLVPAGTFVMGCVGTGPHCEDDERPARKVTLPAFFIDRTEVTARAYRECVQAGACTAEGVAQQFFARATRPGEKCTYNRKELHDHPMNCVDWHQAKTYCEWRQGRLPTEPEWEKAARGPDGRKYPWGNDPFGDVPVANIADVSTGFEWASAHYDDGYPATSPVGAFPAGRSVYGADDLIGNVWEWTADERDEGARGVRGSCWAYAPETARASNRSRYRADSRFEFLGFRCAR